MKKVNLILRSQTIEIKRFSYAGDLTDKMSLSVIQFHYLKNILRFEINDEA